MSETEKVEKSEAKKGNWLSALVGFSAGAIVGSVTALLFAPQSGEETRDRIRERVGEYSDRAGEALDRSRDAFEEARDRMTSAYEDAVDKTSSMIEQAKGKVTKAKQEDEEEEEQELS